MSEVIIRKAVPSDMRGVLSLIQELANYEKAPGEVIIDESALKNDGFGERPLFEAFVAEKGDDIVGLALYYYRYSTWKGKCIHLEDLIVRESERRNGIGKMLFDQMIRTSQEEGVERLMWEVLDWNEPAINFYRKYDAIMEPEWVTCKLVKEQINQY